MEFKREDHRIWLEDENHNLLAEITFPQSGDHVCITHTFVDERLRGQNIASRLMEETMQVLRDKDQHFTAACSYALHWLSQHDEYDDLWIHS